MAIGPWHCRSRILIDDVDVGEVLMNRESQSREMLTKKTRLVSSKLVLQLAAPWDKENRECWHWQLLCHIKESITEASERKSRCHCCPTTREADLWESENCYHSIKAHPLTISVAFHLVLIGHPASFKWLFQWKWWQHHHLYWCWSWGGDH